MKTRALLRNESQQRCLEQNGAAVTDFLTADNITWLLEKRETATYGRDAHSTLLAQDVLNEKLQSKVEYRCINCSPFHIYFSQLSNSKPGFCTLPGITDENKYASLHLIAPLLPAGSAPVEFSYLAGSHLLKVPSRGKNIPGYFENEADYLMQNFSLLKINPGQAVIFFSKMPYAVSIPAQNNDVSLLEISVLPYEARSIIYEGDSETELKFLLPFELTLQDFMEYQSGIPEALNRMKPLRKIPFSPTHFSTDEKMSLMKKTALQKLFLPLARYYKYLFNVD